MGTANDDAVSIEKGKKAGEPYVITVNCPDKTGLSCDISHTILEFDLFITRGDVSTDGKWCYIILWVTPRSSSYVVRWENLKERLLSICPPLVPSFYPYQSLPNRSPSPVYLLKFCSPDRERLLHDVTRVLYELENTIQRVKVTTTPDGCVVDLFFITDNLGLLHTKERQDQLCQRLYYVLGESCISCELQVAGPQYDNLHCVSSLSPLVAEELFRFTLSDSESRSQALSDTKELKRAKVQIDNSLSPVHTLLQISCVDHKGLIYDIMRTLKDCNIHVLCMRDNYVRTMFSEYASGGKKVFGNEVVNFMNEENLPRVQFLLHHTASNIDDCTDFLSLNWSLQLFLQSESVCWWCNAFHIVAYGRFLPVNKSHREIDLFIQHKDGKKIVDPEKQDTICSRLKLEMLHPLRVLITNRGPDTELLVANPTELSGRGRPRVFYDVTSALKSLRICVFLAEIGRHSAAEREWEVYRFLLDENCNFQLLSTQVRSQIVDKVRRVLMG